MLATVLQPAHHEVLNLHSTDPCKKAVFASVLNTVILPQSKMGCRPRRDNVGDAVGFAPSCL